MKKEVKREVGGVPELEQSLKKKEKLVAMLAPCFVAQYDYPEILTQLRDLGFDKIVELTFGAKLVNHEYQKILRKDKGKHLLISSVCPGSVSTIKSQFPQYGKNLIRVYSPMVVTAKVCKKEYPKHKIVFMSPCNFKKEEAKTTDDVDFAIGMNELQALFGKYEINPRKVKTPPKFDLFMNEYTKIYPLAGGLAKTAHVKQILKEGESKSIDGITKVIEFLKHPDKKVKFLDANFCIGGCIGGPLLTPSRSLEEKKKRVLDYVHKALHESIPKGGMGVLKRAKGIKISF